MPRPGTNKSYDPFPQSAGTCPESLEGKVGMGLRLTIETNLLLDTAEVVVIGGGVVGMATAYYTSLRGKDVVLVDKGIPGWEASGRNGGWAGAGGKAGGAVAATNSDLWSGLEEELGQSIEFVQGGSLNIALTEEEAVRAEAIAESSRAAGGDVRVVDLQEMRDILPGITDRALRGTFNPRRQPRQPAANLRRVAPCTRQAGRSHLRAHEGDRGRDSR